MSHTYTADLIRVQDPDYGQHVTALRNRARKPQLKGERNRQNTKREAIQKSSKDG